MVAVADSIRMRMSQEEVLTISVSETGPKLVTNMLVLISVTFSVEKESHPERVGVAQRGRKTCSFISLTFFYSNNMD